MLVFLYLSLILLFVWIVLFVMRPDLRKEILFGSLVAMPFGFTEVFFVPEYWRPETLFGLAPLDIESFIFVFAVGGIAAVSSEFWRKYRHESHGAFLSHVYIILLLLFGTGIFLLLDAILPMNVMYAGILTGAVGATAIGLVHRDLWPDIAIGAAVFTLIYTIAFSIMRFWHPHMLAYWNLNDLTGILLLGIPLEELLWAASFGAFWSPLYEYACRAAKT